MTFLEFSVLLCCCLGIKCQVFGVPQPLYHIPYSYQALGQCNKPGEIYSDCASPCPLTCENYNNPPVCPAVCVQGCTCANKRYVYSDYGCIPREQCSNNKCGPNQSYATNNFNGETCDGLFIQYDKPGCYCKRRFVLNRITGRCVLPQDCPKYPRDQVCPANEYVDSCKNPCERTCKEPRDRECPFPVCNYGCSCKRPLVREESTGICREYQTCPGHNQNGGCQKNEERRKCGPSCEPTCAWPDRSCSGCVNGCFCKKGHVRSSDDGECIPEWVCSYLKQNPFIVHFV